MANIKLLTQEQKEALKTVINESKKLAKVEGSVLSEYMEAIGYEIVEISPLDLFNRLAGLKTDENKEDKKTDE
ncbi:MAG TPA: hypothetical protein GXX42_13845 [Petrimonas sp.]|uniref:hypothetical protein n=1 Tax=Petrimonas sp. TaxID=2023866 RepID=UPI00176645BD|nr:hypothetical protein [Petrimonas sp.]